MPPKRTKLPLCSFLRGGSHQVGVPHHPHPTAGSAIAEGGFAALFLWW